MSTANDIALAVSARLDNITIANGYQTDVGQNVFRGRRRLDPSHLPCVVLIEREDQPAGQSGQREPQVKVKQRFTMEGHADCDPDNPNDVGHKIVADMKKAIWSAPFMYGADKKLITVNYEGRSIAPREEGLAVVSAAVEISVEFVETLGSP